MSDSHILLARPNGDQEISDRALGYASAALRMEIYRLVIQAFQESGVSQATLAKRLHKRPEQISRLLSGPGNWTIDTAAQLLFAIDGSLGKIERRWPQLVRQSNVRRSAYSQRTNDASSATAPGVADYSVRKVTEHAL